VDILASICTKGSEICGLDASRKVKVQRAMETSEAGLRKVFENGKPGGWLSLSGPHFIY
jgi:hypothetical protein